MRTLGGVTKVQSSVVRALGDVMTILSSVMRAV